MSQSTHSLGLLLTEVFQVRQFAKSTKAKTILQIESPQVANSTIPSSPSTVADAHVNGVPNLDDFQEDPPSVDCTGDAPTTPLLDTIAAIEDNTVPICIASRIASPTTTPVQTAADPRLQDFALIKRLGAGAFGTVYLAQHKRSGLHVALKAISKVPESKDDTHRTPKKLEERAARRTSEIGLESAGLRVSAQAEVTALLRAQQLDSVLCILASFHDLGRYYIATVSVLAFPPFYSRQPHASTQEYIPGGDLSSEISYFGAFPLNRVRFYAADLVRLNF